MRFLGTMIDQKINKEYDLYSVNARLLQGMLKNTYLKKMSELDFQLFNDDLKYFRYMRHIKQLKRRESQGLKVSTHYEIDKMNNEMQEVIKSIQANEHHNVKLQKTSELGYELMPIAISVKDKDINKKQDVELLDGFRRMFYTPEVPDVDILVKVYDEVNDTEWINLMIVFNSWKFADRSHAKIYLDRGFRLGLYYRYSLDFTEFYSEYDNFGWGYIDIYTNKLPHSTFWNNLYAHKDIELIYQLIEHRPIFKLVKKRSEEVYDVEQENPAQHPTFLDKMYKVIIAEIGNIRRKEFSAELKGHTVERKSFSLEYVKAYFQREDLQKHFIKLSTMSVPGFMDNYIRDNLVEDMQNYLREYYFKGNIDTFIQKVKYISDHTDTIKNIWGYELKTRLPKGDTVVYRFRDKQVTFYSEKDKFVMEINNKPQYFNTFEEMMDIVLEGADKPLKDIINGLEVLFVI